MELLDIRTFEPGATIEADICIVGSGPAGLTIAREMAGRDLRILVLESGGRDHDPWADTLNEIESVGAPRVMDQTLLRNRVFGGSSSTWSGRLAVLDATDFATREWVPNSGWPISREEVMRYLPRSMRYLGAPFADTTDAQALRTVLGPAGVNGPAFDPQLLREYVWAFSKEAPASRGVMRFGPHALLDQGLKSVRCLLNATVVQVETDPAGRVAEGFEVMGPDGRRRRIRAPLNVLCTGGIENARLLLASTRSVRCGVGNHNGLVGRYLMDHLRGKVGHFLPHDHLAIQRLFNEIVCKVGEAGTVRFAYGFALAPELQRAEKLLNCACWVTGGRSADDPWVSIGALLRRRGNPGQNALNAVRNAPMIAESAKRRLVDRRNLLSRMDELVLECIVEQRPDPESRVTLADHVDAYGVPLSRIDWKVHPDEMQTVRRCAEIVAVELSRLGLPALVQTDMSGDPDAPFVLPDVAHPTGTTRMSDDPAAGVVDTNCAVHGVAGLYIAGSSVFPTSGHANPTQTIVALAIRLADHIGTVIQKPHPRPAPREAPVRSVEPSAIPSADGRPTVLITGATGKLGRKLAALLLDRGYAVRALTSRIPPTGDGIDWRTHDLRQADLDFRRDVEGCQAVLHLAAELRHPDDMARSNAEATGALARAAEINKLRFMCYTSTVSVYGSAARAVSDEDSPVLTRDNDVPSEYWVSDHLRAYGRTKLAGELAIRDAAATVEYVILRPGVIVDIADIRTVIDWTPVRRALLGHRRTHHVYVLDVAEAIVWAMERSLGRESAQPGVTTYNLTDDYDDRMTFSHMLNLGNDGRPQRFGSLRFLPAAMDWLKDYVQYGRGLSLRRPLGFMSFPTRKLFRDGYRHKHGIETVRRMAASAPNDR